MPLFLVTAELSNLRTSELIYENYQILAEDKEEAIKNAYSEWYFKNCVTPANEPKPIEEVVNNWMKCEVIKLHSGKGAGKGGARKGAGRKKGSGSKYSEETKAMKVPVRFDGKMSDVVQMIDDLKDFINNWEDGLQPMEDGHYSERKKLARKMLDDLKSVCGILEEV